MPEQYIVNHLTGNCRFEIELGNGRAILIYMIKAGLFIFLHTEVPEEYEGRGIAAKLAQTALDYAREHGYKVRSYCSYITRYMERHPEYMDLEG